MAEPLTDKELEEMRRRTEDLGELLYGGVRKAMLRLFATIDKLKEKPSVQARG